MFGIGFRHSHYAELLENPQRYQGTGPDAVDFLEVHSENFFGAGGAARAVLQSARAHWPISLHGVGLGLGSAKGLDAWHLEQLADLVVRTEPLLVSDHACFARVTLPQLGAVHASDLLPVPFSEVALQVMCRHVTQVQERLQRTIAVENLSAYFAWNEADYTETQFLSALAQRTGCQLLVDVNNLYVNALNAQKNQTQKNALSVLDPLQSCKDWLDAIPLGVVAEIHLAGHQAMSDIVIDDHSCAVNESVWQLYRHALARFGGLGGSGAIPTLVEWDTDIPPLPELLRQVSLARQCAQEVLA